MWLLALPAAVVFFATFAVRRALRAAPATPELLEPPDPRSPSSGSPLEDSVYQNEIGTTDAELLEAGVPIISDILCWLDDASDRLQIDQKPSVMKVDSLTGRSTFLKFTSSNISMSLWLSGPDFMGEFPRLCLNAMASRDHPGIVIERSAASLEKAVIELQKRGAGVCT
jgi:hypothetical protein